MKPSYDVIVIGAGPGGSTAAYEAAKSGVRVLLLEKNRTIGVPVQTRITGETIGWIYLPLVLRNAP